MRNKIISCFKAILAYLDTAPIIVLVVIYVLLSILAVYLVFVVVAPPL